MGSLFSSCFKPAKTADDGVAGTRSIPNSSPQSNAPRQDAPNAPRQDMCYIGVDFGTSCTGYGYCNNEQMGVVIQSRYPGEMDPTAKTLSALLYEVNGGAWTPIAWGMDAQKRFQALSRQDSNNYRLVTNFKLPLLGDDPRRFCLPTDCPHDAVTVVSHFLAFVKQHIEKSLQRSVGTLHNRAKLKWCFTVPAGSSHAAKDRLRQAVYKAGIISHLRDPSLVLAHEPEAAAMTACKQDRLRYKADDLFMVVDAGGGTVDLTIHDVELRNGAVVLSEATHRDGLLAGSVCIDEQFQQYFCSKCGGKQLVESWSAQYPQDQSRMMAEWERLKKNFHGDQRDSTEHNMSLPRPLRNLMPADAKERLMEEQDGFDDELIIPSTIMENFFSRVTDSIIMKIREFLGRVPNGRRPNRVLLVGGLGQSPYLYRRLQDFWRNELGQVSDLVCPDFAISAVLQGAVLQLQQPEMVHARRCVYSYGVDYMVDWQEGAPTREWHQGREVTFKGFSRFVEVDESVQVDAVIRKVYAPIAHTQTLIKFDIFASKTRGVQYITDKGVFKVGNVTVPVQIAPGAPLESARVCLTFQFGTAEIQVTAEQESTKTAVDTIITFDSSSEQPPMHAVPLTNDWTP